MPEGRILIVDDEEVIRDLMSDLLKEEGDYEIFTAASGEEALNVCAGNEIDLVFSDLRMPGMSGTQLLEFLKRDFPELPVVIITGYGGREDVIDALRLGASNFLLKPIEVEMVASIASRLISLRHREKLSAQVFDFLIEEKSEFSIPSDLRYTLALIDQIAAPLEKLAICSGAELKNVRLALDEALVNAVVHGNLEISSEQKGSTLAELVEYDQLVKTRSQQEPYRNRRIRISTEINASGARFTIEDEGNGFDHSVIPADFSEVDNLTSHGRGLLLIKAFMDEVSFNQKGNIITMCKAKQAGGAAGY